MTLAFLVYLAGVVAKFGIATMIVGLASLFVVVVMTVGFMISEGELRPSSLAIKLVATAVITAWTLNILTPSEKTMYVMAGAYAAQSIAENPKVGAVSEKLVKLIESKLEHAITEGVEAGAKKVEEKVAK